MKRFWAKVEKTDGCWEWGTKSRNAQGYGLFWFKGRCVRAHRFSWELANGPIPKGMQVCHACDNPPCVRLAHLFLGTMNDNNQDKKKKGRARGGNLKGEQSWNSKLTETIVKQIRLEYQTGSFSQYELARKYKVSRGAIQKVVERTNWKHL